MPAINSPYFNIQYGWTYGEDGWNPGMDENLLRSSFLMRNAVTEFTPSLPSSPPDGYSCILTTDNLAYFRVGGNYVFVEIEEGYEFTTLVDGKRWKKESSGYVEIPTTSELNVRVGPLEDRVDTAEGNITSLQEDVNGLSGEVGGIVGDASNLPVTSESQTMSLAEWMTYVRNRANHTGTQQASTISDFEEAVTSRVSQTVGSDTLEIEYDADQEVIYFDNPQGKASEFQSVDGSIQITSEGGAVVLLTEDITEVLLPPGDFFTTKVLNIKFIQDSATPYTVSGWPSDVEWAKGAAPVISPELDSQALITLVNIGNRGWVGVHTGDGINSIVQGDGILVDNTDPTNPLVSVDVGFFSPVASTGSYNDLIDIPTLGSAASEDIASFDPAGEAEGVNTTLTTLINERMSSAARDAVNALDPTTATIEDLILALQS